MNKLNPIKTGLVMGFVLGGFHFMWSILVFIGFAQTLLNFIFWAHMLKTQELVADFDPTAAVTLVVLTFIIGFIIGKIFAMVWNKLHRK